jgi:hypothetical protein
MLISMTVLAGVAALAMAACCGYYLGRRAGSAAPTWKKRTSRIALGKLAISLLALTTARRIRRSFRAEPVLADALGIRALRFIAPLELLRGSLARIRSY